MKLPSFFRKALTTQYERLTPVLSDVDIARIREMMDCVNNGPGETKPSKYWELLNSQNTDQLIYTGFESFKKTVALNYFTFVNLLPWDPQIRFFFSSLPVPLLIECIRRALASRKIFDSRVGLWQSWVYCFLCVAGWKYLREAGIETKLSEPELGGAIPIRDNGALISSDLSNSILEYESIKQYVKGNVLELGAGYGRTAYVVMSMVDCRYVIVDVAPALWIAEKYLSTLFPQKRLFSWRKFNRFDDVRSEFLEAELIFLTSDQIVQLPSNHFDLVINISSLHEMRPEQITFYLNQIDRLMRFHGHFYSKQWAKSVNPVDEVKILQTDYPIPNNWARLLARPARVQASFFEEVFMKSDRA